MKRIAVSLILIFSFSLQASAIKAQWKKVQGGKDVEVFSGEVTGSDVVAFRGKGVIDAPLKSIVSAFYDMERKKEWMHALEDVRTLEVNGKNRIEYYHSKSPWPVWDRDFIYEVDWDLSEDRKHFVIKLKDIDSNKSPKKDNVVRGELSHSSYHMESIDGGKRTKIQVEILADPKGSVPKWLVNVFQRMWPINTIDNLRKFVTSKDFEVHPKVEDYFAGKIKL